jgi:hypothetical protein
LATLRTDRLSRTARRLIRFVEESTRVAIPLEDIEDALDVRGAAVFKAIREAERAGSIERWGDAVCSTRKLQSGAYFSTNDLSDAGIRKATASPYAGLTDAMYVPEPPMRRGRRPGDEGDTYRRFANDERYSTLDSELMLLGIGRTRWEPSLEYARDDDGDVDFENSIPRGSCTICKERKSDGFWFCAGCTNASAEAESYAAWQTAKAEQEIRDDADNVEGYWRYSPT